MEKKSPWMDVSRIWKRIAAVIAAVGVGATAITKVFNTSADITYTVAACIGFIALMVSWYTDKQADYIYKDMEECKKDLLKNIDDHNESVRNDITNINKNITELVGLTKETQKDTTRIQLVMYIQTDPKNKDTILKLAQKYFCKLGGDWFITAEFSRWAKEQNVEIPPELFKYMKENEHE